MKHWGLHTVLNLSRCCPYSIRSSLRITEFSNRLVKAIDMEQYGTTQIQHFGKEDKKGFSFQTHLTTSHLCGHFSEDLNSAFIDCFSCKDYNPAIVEKVAREFFLPEDVERIELFRGELSKLK